MDFLRENPFRIGWMSIRANRLAMAVLIGFAVVLSALYFLVPGVSGFLEPLRAAMERYGAAAAFLSMVVFIGVIPAIFFWIDPSIRPASPCRTSVLTVLWRASLGVLCTWFFQAQDFIFGEGTDLPTLALKTALDQFLWTPFVLAPLDATYYFWAGCDYSFRRLRGKWPRSFVCGVLLPNLLAGWCIGIPTNLLLYAFPVSLRIVFSGLLGAFWMLVCLQIGIREASARNGVGTASSGRRH